MNRLLMLLLLVAPMAPVTGAEPALGLAAAQRVGEAASRFARANAAPGAAIAIVDAGGQLVWLQRLDGTFPAGAEISVGKARTAALFRRPTRVLEETINKGRPAMLALSASHGFTPLLGGVPIVAGDTVIGAIGVSGAASAQQDEEIALAGAAAFAAAPAAGTTESADTARLVSSTAVAAAYAEGETGGTLVAQPQFRVNASRRDGPGQAEVHDVDTDIFYVVEGSAQVVIGGELVAPRRVAAAEIRGLALRGGASHRIGAGDVLTIPHGTPHWFRSVDAPFRYFVVKSVTGVAP